MKKVLLVLFVLGATAWGSFAQPKSDGGKFSIGIDAGLPTGNASNIFSSAIGGSLKYDMPILSGIYLTASAGYASFKVKSSLKYLDLESTDDVVPLKGGVKVYFSNGFFAEGQLGAAFSTAGGGGTFFIYAPGIGYTFNFGFESGIRYEAWAKNGTISQVAMRLAYRF